MPSVMVVGARGYTGSELLPILHRHPSFDLCAVGSGSASGERVSAHVDGLEGSNLVFSNIQPASLEAQRADALVLALPNGVAAPYVEAVERCSPETVIVDLSADYRFDSGWAYGQPERFRDQLAGSRRIANPGCYATAAQLALAPLQDVLTAPAKRSRARMIPKRWRTTFCLTAWSITCMKKKCRTTLAGISVFCRMSHRFSGGSA